MRRRETRRRVEAEGPRQVTHRHGPVGEAEAECPGEGVWGHKGDSKVSGQLCSSKEGLVGSCELYGLASVTVE